ncbi:MAG: ABC transporter permease [Pseudomonadales bacterium]|nr:ABC transporter permease [Pseudomonadales bacterium]
MLLIALAWRNIFRQKRRSLLTALSMAGGYLVSAFAISLSEGSYNGAINFFTEDHSGHIQIHQANYLKRPKIHKTINNPQTISTQLKQNTNIRSHTLRVFAPVLAYSETKNSHAQLVGIDLALEQQTSRLAEKIIAGQFINNQQNTAGYYAVMISSNLARVLNISLGDELILISQGADGSVANDLYIVGGIINNKNARTVYLPLNAAQLFLSLPNKVHQIAILLNHSGEAIEQAQHIQQLLSAESLLGDSFPGESVTVSSLIPKLTQAEKSLRQNLTNLTVSPWQEVEATFYQSMQADKRGMNITLGIILFIVFIGVLNTVLMSVMERTREFGVLKAIGSRPLQITTLITLETTMLASMSIVTGFALSIPLILWFKNTGLKLSQPVDIGGVVLDRMTGDMNLYVFLAPAIAMLTFSILVSIPPAFRAASISPTKALGSH